MHGILDIECVRYGHWVVADRVVCLDIGFRVILGFVDRCARLPTTCRSCRARDLSTINKSFVDVLYKL